MAVKAPITSSLNPNAPLFVPATYMATEDFSPEWWNLVQTSPAFRDYWIRERFECVDDEELTAEDLDELDTVEGFIDQQLEFLDEEQNELAHIEAENDLEGPVSNESVELAKDIKDLNVSSIISIEEHQKSVDQTVCVDQTVSHIAQS